MWVRNTSTLAALLSLFLWCSSASAQEATRVVVKFAPEVTQAQAQELITEVAVETGSTATLDSFRTPTHIALLSTNTETSSTFINALNAQDVIVYAHADVRFEAAAQSTPWGVSTNGVNTETLHTDGVTGSGTIVAIVDSGADLDHPDLAAHLWHPADDNCIIDGEFVSGGCPNGGYDFANGDDTPEDDNEHGTHVAGIIGALDNDIGVVGVAPDAQLMIIKSLDSSGYGSYTTIVEGIQFAIDNGAQIINLSLGSMYDDLVPQSLLDIFNEAESAGVLVVAATGNDASHVPYLPSQFSTVLSVGAVQETPTQENPETSYDTRLAYFSNWGKVDVVAPGVRINSTIPNDTYSGDTWEGTSMATPMVSGVAALLLSQNPSLTPAQLRFIIESTATDLGETGKDDFFGAGLVNADAAVAALASSAHTILVEPNWSENSTDDLGDGLYDVTRIYTARMSSDTTDTSTVRVQLREANGTPLAGAQLSATLSSGTITTALPAATDADGFVYIGIKAPDTAARATLTLIDGATSYATTLIFADTLFVNDAGQPEDTDINGWIYQRALEDNNVLWTESAQATPQNIDTLNNFDTVVWNTGSYGLNINEQATLIDFLAAQKNLILFGGNMLSSYAYYNAHSGASILSIDAVFADYLGVSFVASTPESIELTGTGSLGTFDATSSISASDSYAALYSDVIGAREGTTVLAYYCDNAQDAIVEHVDGYHAITSGVNLELYPKANRTDILGRLLNVMSDTPNTNAGVGSGCDASDNNATQDAHAQSDLSVTPDVLSTEVDSLNNVDLSVSGSTAVITWDNASGYIDSSASAVDLSDDTSIDASGNRTSITIEGLDTSSQYIIVLFVASSTEALNPYYLLLTTDPQAPADLTLSELHRKSFTVETTTPNEYETLSIELGDAQHTVLRTLSSTTGSNTLIDLSPRTDYAVRARIVGRYDTSAWTPWLAVTTASDRVHKPTAEGVDAHTVKVFWKKPTHSTIKSYRVQIFRKKNGSYHLYDSKNITKHMSKKNRSTLFDQLPSGYTYRVRVRATFHNGDVGPYSRVRRITAESFNQ